METKPGYKTTEFWLAGAAMLTGAVISSGILDKSESDVDNQIFGLIATVLAALGYGAYRAFTKNSDNKAAVILAAAEAASKPTDPPKPQG